MILPSTLVFSGTLAAIGHVVTNEEEKDQNDRNTENGRWWTRIQSSAVLTSRCTETTEIPCDKLACHFLEKRKTGR